MEALLGGQLADGCVGPGEADRGHDDRAKDHDRDQDAVGARELDAAGGHTDSFHRLCRECHPDHLWIDFRRHGGRGRTRGRRGARITRRAGGP